MIAAALRAEADEYVERFSDELDEDGHRLVVRNGRKVTIGSGAIAVRTPRVNAKRIDEEGERQKFSSRILPAYARRSPKVGEVIPILYLKGLSTGDFRPALEGLLGEDAARLSATTVSRMCKDWEEHHARFRQQLLSFTAWAALRDLFPSSGEQRRWFHASGNVIDALPKWLQSRAKGFLNHLRPQDAPDATQRPRSLRGPTTHAATPPAGASLVAVDDDRQRPAHRRALICERSCGKRSIEPPCR